MTLDAIAAYREAIRKNYNSSVNSARLDKTAHESIAQAEEKFTLISSTLESAWHYSVSTEAMQRVGKKPGTLKQVHLPPTNHLWIELSSPLPVGYVPFPSGNSAVYQLSRAPIAAMWFYWPDLERSRRNQAVSTEPGRWILQLINTSGQEHDTFFYDAQPGKWSLTKLVAQGQRHHEIEKYLNTWRNRLREALFLIQQNGYRPGLIV